MTRGISTIGRGACRLAFAFSGLAMMTAAATGAQAGVVLDQASPAIAPGSAISNYFGSFNPPAGPVQTRFVQSFTAGRAGYLDHLEFELVDMRAVGTVTFQLYAGDYMAGGSSLLLTGTLDTSQVADFLADPLPLSSFDVRSADFLVAAGTRYSVAISYQPATGFGGITLINGHLGFAPDWSPISIYNDYAGGTLTLVSSAFPPGTGTTMPGDVGFRSYVEELAAPVPEPASWAMMIAGLGLAGGALRRRRVAGAMRFA